MVEATRAFIRTEFGSEDGKRLQPDLSSPQIAELEVSDAILYSLASQVDSEISEISNSFALDVESDRPEDLARQIYQLICHPQVGSKVNSSNVEVSEFVAAVTPRIAAQERLLFVLLGFPFKDQNRFRVDGDADQPDLGEIAFLLRLYRAVQAIYQLHTYGADILVLTDGRLYQEVFGVPAAKVDRYAEILKAYRSSLNLQGAVSFISLKDLVDRASVAADGEAETSGAKAVQLRIRERVEVLVRSEPSLRVPFECLVSGMKWNHESRELLHDATPDGAWKVLTGPREEVDPSLVEQWDDLHKKASEAALSYLSTNLMLRWLDLVRLYFPDAIRCTIHAKPGQICLTRTNAAFPWNGVAWTSDWPTSIDDFEVRPWHTLNELGPVRKVTVRTIGRPCFYTTASDGSNIAAARGVLPGGGWKCGEIEGRYLTADDGAALAALGVEDENFAWERLTRNHEYYQKILRFRLAHYQQYGFGVHGIWLRGDLIGQCGLQVLNETRDQVEFVVFLGKSHVRKGVGRRLTEHVLSRCRDAGLRTIYGVVRPENQAGVALLRRFNARPVKTQVHFGYPATVFSIPIGRR
ncbi:MAG: hypothetical protein AMXMBFR57_20190 [Acidimicrobiia bacterium]